MNKTKPSKFLTLFSALVFALSGLVFQAAGVAFAQGQTNAPAAAPLVSTYTSSAKFGIFLVNPKGMPLYVASTDFGGRTACVSSACTAIWIPYIVQSSSNLTEATGLRGKLGTLTRSDGSLQLTFNNLALYTYAKDTQQDTPTGNGIGKIWYLATPNVYPGNVGPSSPAPSNGGYGGYSGGGGGYGGGGMGHY